MARVQPRAVLFLICIAFCAAWSTFNGIASVGYHGDEGAYLNDGVWYDQWVRGDFTSLRTVTYAKLLDAPVGPLVAGLSRRVAGLDLAPGLYQWDFRLPPDQSLLHSVTPSESHLIAGRLPMALMAFATLMLLASFLLNQFGFIACACAMSFLILNPSTIDPLRMVMTESPLLFYSVLGLVFCARGVALLSVAKLHTRAIGLLFGGGLAIGLSTASKNNGVMALAACMLAIALYLVSSMPTTQGIRAFHRIYRAIRSAAVPFTVTIVAAVGIYVVINPFLWSRPWQTMADVIKARNDSSIRQQQNYSSDALTSLRTRMTAGLWRVFTQDSSLGCDPHADGKVVLDTVSHTFHWETPTAHSSLAGSFLCAPVPPWSDTIRLITLVNITLCIIGTARVIVHQLQILKLRPYVVPATTLLLWGVVLNIPIILLSPMNWSRYYLLPVVFTSIAIAIGLAVILSWIGQWMLHILLQVKLPSTPQS